MRKLSMAKPRRGNRDLIKAMNRNLVLNILRQQGPISRTQLTEISGLSVGSVSQITNELLQEHWIVEVGEGDYTGGRRQVMLRLNPAAGYVVGLKLMEDRIVCAITDLEVGVLRYAESRLVANHTPHVVSAELALAVEQVIALADIPRDRVLGVGIGLAGVIDCLSGVVHYSPFFQWRDIPLAELLAFRLGLPVYLENDVNSLTITEQLVGLGHEIADFAVITMGRGIGMGMVLNHQLHTGIHGGVGELGHVTITRDGPLCDCGKHGCLEAVASDQAVIREYKAACPEDSAVTIDTIIQAAQQNDPTAQRVLAESGYYFGMGVALVINIVCPSLIIVSGEGVAAGDFRLKPMFEAIRQHSFNGSLDRIEIRVQPTDDQTWACGAAGLVVGKLFEPPLIESLEA
jgi:predicted NBD/HSP70 family sugar kinase